MIALITALPKIAVLATDGKDLLLGAGPWGPSLPQGNSSWGAPSLHGSLCFCIGSPFSYKP